MFPLSPGEARSPVSFYGELAERLAEVDFPRRVSTLCSRVLSERVSGHPPVEVYFKMLLVGFLENLATERSIAARCWDSLSVRAFLGYGIEGYPSDLDRPADIVRRLGPEVCQSVFEVIAGRLRALGLLEGRPIDGRFIEANPNLRALAGRNTESDYWDYLRELTGLPAIGREEAPVTRMLDDTKLHRERNIPARRASFDSSEDEHQARWLARATEKRGDRHR